VYKDKVIVSKGFGLTGESAVVLNASDLSPSFEASGITGNCEGIAIIGDTAYIANPSSFVAASGSMVVLDLNGQNLQRIMNMDTLGRQIQDLHIYQNKIYSVNIIKFNNPTYGVISEYNPQTTTFVHHKIDLPLVQSAGIIDNKLYLDINGALGAIDLGTVSVSDTALVPGFWAGMTVDTVNDRLYLTTTDYFSFGKLYSYDLQGNRLDSVDVGISPEALAVDYNTVVSAEDPKTTLTNISAFPQPFNQHLSIDLQAFGSKAVSIKLLDIFGRNVLEQQFNGARIAELNTAHIPAGTYFLSAVSGNEIATFKVLKIER
jgi:hypothetical protein